MGRGRPSPLLVVQEEGGQAGLEAGVVRVEGRLPATAQRVSHDALSPPFQRWSVTGRGISQILARRNGLLGPQERKQVPPF